MVVFDHSDLFYTDTIEADAGTGIQPQKITSVSSQTPGFASDASPPSTTCSCLS